jgi:hypothetical protein
MVKNNGQIPQYYVENSHPAIIDRDMWEQVQIELKRRERIGAKYSSSDIFASKLICEDCGGFYGKKKWHSNSKYSRYVYQCNNKFHKHKDKCQTPNLSEEDIKLKFIRAYNLSMEDRKRIIEDTCEVIELLTDTAKLDDAISGLEDEIMITSEIVSRLVNENSKTDIALEDYNKKYEELSNRYDRLKNKHADLLNERNEKQGQALIMKVFIKNLSESEDKLDEWNERIWMLLVDGATVHRDSSITFKLYNGIYVKTK